VQDRAFTLRADKAMARQYVAREMKKLQKTCINLHGRELKAAKTYLMMKRSCA
jgi:hypothetical protein